MIDTTSPMKIVTQFRTKNNTSYDDPVVEMRRIFVQNNKTFNAPSTNITGMETQYNSIKDGMCNATKEAFGDINHWAMFGGMKQMSDSIGDTGFVLSISINDDPLNHMQWLDSNFPASKTTPGGPRGSCATDLGDPAMVEQTAVNAYVQISNLRFGEIGSTFSGTPMQPTPQGYPSIEKITDFLQ